MIPDQLSIMGFDIVSGSSTLCRPAWGVWRWGGIECLLSSSPYLKPPPPPARRMAARQVAASGLGPREADGSTSQPCTDWTTRHRVCSMHATIHHLNKADRPQYCSKAYIRPCTTYYSPKQARGDDIYCYIYCYITRPPKFTPPRSTHPRSTCTPRVHVENTNFFLLRMHQKF